MKKRLLLFFGMVLLGLNAVLAQNQTVKGKVTIPAP
jgi:hypothetical protein